MGLGSFDEKFQPNGVPLAAKENTHLKKNPSFPYPNQV